jgi:hypothetical protein
MTEDRQHDTQGGRDTAAQDPSGPRAGDALRSTRDDLSPEHDQPVEGGVEQAEDDTTPTTAG